MWNNQFHASFIYMRVSVVIQEKSTNINNILNQQRYEKTITNKNHAPAMRPCGRKY